jgi:trans-aconitate methyltransferase
LSVSDTTSHTNWNADQYVSEAGFVTKLGSPVYDLLAPKKGERILDLGCGDGALSKKILQSGALVVGVDGSPSMVESAQAQGIDARLVDAQSLTFKDEFDAVFSNAALHWMLQADDVIDGVKRALKPGGRFVAECGGFGNVAAIVSAMHAVLKANGYDPENLNPWYYPSVSDYTERLERAGFRVSQIELIHRPTPLPAGLRAWLDMFCQALFDPTGEQADELKDQVVEALRYSLYDEKDGWFADYVRLRFVAFCI